MEDFTAQDKTELSVKLGDRVTVMAKDPSGMHALGTDLRLVRNYNIDSTKTNTSIEFCRPNRVSIRTSYNLIPYKLSLHYALYP